MMKEAILITAFGAISPKARATYALLERDVRDSYQDREIRWAYTAKSIVNRLKAKGESASTVPEALATLHAEGCLAVSILSLHLVPGQMHEEMAADIPAGLCAAITRPLLDEDTSIARAAQDIMAECPSDRPVLVVAHGNGHIERFNGQLLALKQHLKADGRFHLALLEGDPDEKGLEAFIQKAKEAGKVHIYPFLYLEGDHVNNDILGDEPDSFKQRIGVPDFTCNEGLGKKTWVRQRFLQRLREIMQPQ